MSYYDPDSNRLSRLKFKSFSIAICGFNQNTSSNAIQSRPPYSSDVLMNQKTKHKSYPLHALKQKDIRMLCYYRKKKMFVIVI